MSDAAKRGKARAEAGPAVAPYVTPHAGLRRATPRAKERGGLMAWRLITRTDKMGCGKRPSEDR